MTLSTTNSPNVLIQPSDKKSQGSRDAGKALPMEGIGTRTHGITTEASIESWCSVAGVCKLLVVLILMLSGRAAYACAGTTASVNVGSFTTNANPAVGSLLSSSAHAYGANAYVLTFGGCSYGSYSFTSPVDAPTGITWQSTTVYPTGVANIGYAVQARDYHAYDNVPLNNPFQSYPANGTKTIAQAEFGWQWFVYFVATGPLEPGTYTLPAHVVARVTGGGLTGYLAYGGFTVTVPGLRGTCGVTSPLDQSIALPTVTTAAFTGVGSVPPQRSTVANVSLSCDPNTTVNASVSDATDAGNAGTTLNLTGGSGASGVGVQLYRDGLSTPLSLGSANQWQVGSSSSAQNYAIPFVASYVQTGSKVAAGSVQAKATVTLTYQ